MRVRVTLLFLVVVCGTPSFLSASEPFGFVSDVIQSLQTCRIASDRIKENKDRNVLSLMKDVRVFISEIRQANSMMAQHANSNNELIRESSNNFSKIYSSIMANNERMLDFLEKTLNDLGQAASKQGTWLREASEIMAKNEELWRLLPQITVLTTYTLVDLNRTKEGKLSFLTITKAERDLLRSQLHSAFGDKVKEPMKGGALPIDVSAKLLWFFLAKPFNPSDIN